MGKMYCAFGVTLAPFTPVKVSHWVHTAQPLRDFSCFHFLRAHRAYLAELPVGSPVPGGFVRTIYNLTVTRSEQDSRKPLCLAKMSNCSFKELLKGGVNL